MRQTQFPLFLLAAFLSTQSQGIPSTLEIDRNAGPARVSISGEPARHLVLQSTTNLTDPNGWKIEAIMPLTNLIQRWFDSRSVQADSPRKFFRAMEYGTIPEPVMPDDFRLIDHQDRSRALYYHTVAHGSTNRAVVLVFTGNGCTNVRQVVSTIKSLRDRYTARGVIFWMIDANSSDTRSNIVAEANSQGINLPILHDDAQIVARNFGITKTPEAIAINATNLTIFYRGAIDDRIGPSTNLTTQPFLDSALANYLAGSSVVSPNQTAPYGCDVEYRPLQPSISYVNQIAPILQAKCVQCHSPGNIAPWAMTNYSVIQLFADSIRNEVLAARMPPWHADPHYQRFTNDSSLTIAEKSVLLQWLREGAPRGTGADPLEIPTTVTNYPMAWPANLGAPSNIITVPVQNLPASGQVPYVYYTTPPTTQDMWVKAAVVKPGNLKVLHHCLVYFGTNSALMGLDGFFSGYVPGAGATEFPAGTGKFVPSGSRITFQLHYVTTGTNETDQTQLGLYTLPVRPAFELFTKSAFNPFFSIPPGAPDHQVTGQFVFPAGKRVRIYEMSPHMHYRGSRFRFDAILPGGVRQTLLNVPKYDFDWQQMYRLTQPVDLPAGSRIEGIGAFDNSAQNLHNPDPTATVTFGEQTTEEMFIGYFNYVELP